jgi:quercetin dioxygenase-like cupin family protein
MKADVDTAGVIVPITDGEAILRREKREISILVARDEVTITHARYSAGERVASLHVHHEHTDAFYVLEGELTFAIGREAEAITVSSGGFVAAPPQVAHSFRNDGNRPARWLTIHAHDGGFAAFMRGARDGVEVEWDISQVPAEGGLPASEAIVSRDLGGERPGSGNRLCWLRCALPDLCVVEWHLRGPHVDLPFHDQDSRVDSFFVIEGELEATLAGTTQTVGPGTLISVPRGAQHTLNHRGPQPVRMLSLHTPDAGFIDYLRRGSGTRRNPLGRTPKHGEAKSRGGKHKRPEIRQLRDHALAGGGASRARDCPIGSLVLASQKERRPSAWASGCVNERTSGFPRVGVRAELSRGDL